MAQAIDTFFSKRLGDGRGRTGEPEEPFSDAGSPSLATASRIYKKNADKRVGNSIESDRGKAH